MKPSVAMGNEPQRKMLTDRLLRSLSPAPTGQRYTVWDAAVPGFGVRVSGRASAGKAVGISFIVMRRLPGGGAPVRHTIGRYHPDLLPLSKAREEARRTLALIAGGAKPSEEKRRREREEAERRASTVGALAEDFIADMKRRELRHAGEFTQIIRREFLGQKYTDGAWRDGRDSIWRERPLAEVSAQDAARRIRAILSRGAAPEPGRRRRKSGGAWAAHHALAIAKTMWNWAIEQQAYGIEASPFERLTPKRLIGEKKPRRRILDDSEIRAVWKAAERFGGAYGDLVKLLMLTGQRVSQAAEMQRGEIDLDKALWLTPAGKMKKDRPHATPLAPAAAALLRDRLGTPSHRNGFVFSTTGGERPISGFSKFKSRLDALADKERREEVGEHRALLEVTPLLADKERREEVGEAAEPIPHWTLHDLRRTVRSGLPALRVPDVVAEAILAHARPGIAGVYDVYSYLDEKRDALERWASRLAAIVNPVPLNIVPMRRVAE